MTQKTIRRLAADVLNVGESRIWLDPNQGSRINEALTRDDVRKLISEGVVKAFPSRGVSRQGARERQEGRRVGRRRGHGSRKGSVKARTGEKEVWIAKVRAQRRLIKSLKADGELTGPNFRKAYMLVKGSTFKGMNALKVYLKENQLISAKAAEGAKKGKRPAAVAGNKKQ